MLSTPPAFILSQDQTLMLKVLSRQFLSGFLFIQTNLNLLFLRFFEYSKLFVSALKPTNNSHLNLSRFYSLFSYQGSNISSLYLLGTAIVVSATAHLLYHSRLCLSTTFFHFFLQKFLSFAISLIIISHFLIFVNSFLFSKKLF